MNLSKGFFDIDLDKIETPNIDPNWKSTKSYGRNDIVKWVKQLKEVQRLSRDNGYTYYDFSMMRDSKDPIQRELGNTHHKFYDHTIEGSRSNHDYIKICSNDSTNKYVIENGQHRVFAAKELGLTTIPCMLTASEEKINQLRNEKNRSPLLAPEDPARTIRERQLSSANLLAPNIDEKSIWNRQQPISPEQNRKFRVNR